MRRPALTLAPSISVILEVADGPVGLLPLVSGLLRCGGGRCWHRGGGMGLKGGGGERDEGSRAGGATRRWKEGGRMDGEAGSEGDGWGWGFGRGWQWLGIECAAARWQL